MKTEPRTVKEPLGCTVFTITVFLSINRILLPCPMPSRLEQQIAFILEIDRLKTVLRQTVVVDQSRRENTAEHSWHLAVMAMVLAEHANHPPDILKVLKMVLVHDIVEIDAGDTFGYDDAGHDDKAEREQRAADRLFSLLPDDQANELRALWDEFEARETSDARFALALDRLNPILLNLATDGHSWKRHGITRERVVERNDLMAEGSEDLWSHVSKLLDEAEISGLFDHPASGQA